MAPDEIKKLAEEFKIEKERWTDLRMQMVFRSSDLRLQNAEREFNLTLSLVSVSVAFLAIVVPLAQANISLWMIVGTIILSIASILGLIDLVYVIYRDRKYIEEDRQYELDTLGKYQKSAAEIPAELEAGKTRLEKKAERGEWTTAQPYTLPLFSSILYWFHKPYHLGYFSYINFHKQPLFVVLEKKNHLIRS